MRMFLNFLFMTQFEKTFANCCLIFSLSVAIIVLIASALIFMKP